MYQSVFPNQDVCILSTHLVYKFPASLLQRRVFLQVYETIRHYFLLRTSYRTKPHCLSARDVSSIPIMQDRAGNSGLNNHVRIAHLTV